MFDEEGCYISHFFEDTCFNDGGPFTDSQTRNLVLQEMATVDASREIQRRRQSMASSLDELLGVKTERGMISDQEAEKISRQIKTVIEEKGPAFRHTEAYYRAIADERERKAAYKAIELTGVPHAEEKDIAEHPLRYLGLPDDATFEQARASYITLSRVYHPDVISLSNRRQRELIFEKEPYTLPSGQSLDDFIGSLDGKTLPGVKSPAAIAKLTDEERAKYFAEHEAYHALERQHEAVKQEMQVRATKKMQVITKAYSAAKKLFSAEESLGGFSWERVVTHSPLTDMFSSWMGKDIFQHLSLSLEGNGELRRDVGKFTFRKEVCLSFDYGEVYMMGEDYMQQLPLKEFFAWTELRQGRVLSPLLLDDVIKEYALDPDRAERLRVMIMNRESPDFIVDCLEIPEECGSEGNPLRWFIEGALLGPTFNHVTGPRTMQYCRLGVEMTPLGGLVLKYRSQDSQHNWWFGDGVLQTAEFTLADVKMMMLQAYGPMLAEPELR